MYGRSKMLSGKESGVCVLCDSKNSWFMISSI
jgi:hypothetical protein